MTIFTFYILMLCHLAHFITIVFLLWFIGFIITKMMFYNAFFILNHFRGWGPGFLSLPLLLPSLLLLGIFLHFFYFPPIWDFLFLVWYNIRCIKLNYDIPSNEILSFIDKCIAFIVYYNRCFVLSLLFYVMIFVVIVVKLLPPPFKVYTKGSFYWF